jgi:hypothetical protein
MNGEGQASRLQTCSRLVDGFERPAAFRVTDFSSSFEVRSFGIGEPVTLSSQKLSMAMCMMTLLVDLTPGPGRQPFWRYGLR